MFKNCRFHYMAVADNRQRYMPLPDDRLPSRGQALAYPEAVLLVNPVEPELKGEVFPCTCFIYNNNLINHIWHISWIGMVHKRLALPMWLILTNKSIYYGLVLQGTLSDRVKLWSSECTRLNMKVISFGHVSWSCVFNIPVHWRDDKRVGWG